VKIARFSGVLARFAPLAAAASLAAPGCIAEKLETGADREAIVNGQLNPGDDAVVALTVGGQQFCTGTVVTPTIVVTAAHCLPPNLGGVAMNQIELVVGGDVNNPTDVLSVSTGLAHAAWNENVLPNDVGVLALVEPAPMQPIPMLNADLGQMSPIGQTVRMVGYGITAFEGTGNGIKRSGDMSIDAVDASTIYLGPGPSLTCNGDSGGPLLMEVNGSEVLAGIHSRSDCDTQSLNERVDVHATGFIREFIADNGGGAECTADGLCAEGCASPDPDCPCIEDGLCTNACPALATDPDCPADCGVADGVCPDGCPSADVDCTGDDTAGSLEGGCSTGGASGTAASLLLILGLMAIRRRRERGLR
jgi:hypothetical protein